MNFERKWTGNWENAFHGLRHPLESYYKSDSYLSYPCRMKDCNDCFFEEDGIKICKKDTFYIGSNDMDLAKRMIKAGTPNDKFLRQIFVSVDITAPLYWWKEMDTYKVATTANSTSTMHRLASTPITVDCFEMDDYSSIGRENDKTWEMIIDICEDLRKKYNETKDKKYWKELIRLLPESWQQTRMWSSNYSVLRNIIHWRQGHKLSEWHQFVDWCKTLPYAEDFLFYAQSEVKE